MFLTKIMNRQRNKYGHFLKMNVIFLLLSIFGVTSVSQSQESALTKLQGDVLLEGVAPEIPFPDWFTQSFLEIADDAEEAAADGKHVMLYFHMNGCPYCYQMAMESFVETPYADFIQQNFNVIELNWDGDRGVVFNEQITLPEKELIKHLGVRASPTTLFLDDAGKVIYRVDGYRDRETFKQIMEYVASGAIAKTSFKAYQANLEREKVFVFTEMENAQSTEQANLEELSKKPLMLLFESEYCSGCDHFHQKVLANSDAKALLKKFTLIRINTEGNKSLVGFDGEPITERELAQDLQMLDYEPGVLLYDNGQELRRIDHKLFTFHFVEGLRWVADKYYQQHAKFYPWVDLRMAELMASGQKINLTE